MRKVVTIIETLKYHIVVDALDEVDAIDAAIDDWEHVNPDRKPDDINVQFEVRDA
jgi:hypothetical protein